MIDYYETKEHPITRKMVLDAYKAISTNGKAAGVDSMTLTAFATNVSGNLYKIWNRMTSGSYIPPPVREVEIPKKSGGIRKLGIPTVADKIAQQVVRKHLELKVEGSFHRNSYGYRVGKNAHMAVDKAYIRCRYNAWVLDLDIKGFFDNIDHGLLMKAVQYYTKEKWVLLYIERWLKAGIMRKGLFIEKRSGTPQGGVISPLLSNIFMHFTFDMWMTKLYPNITFERYCDDIIVHCVTEGQAKFIKDKISRRLKQCGLELNQEKTKMVYCKNDTHREKHESSSFEFLGFTFKPHFARTKKGSALMFAPQMSSRAKKVVRDKIKQATYFVPTITVQRLAMKLNERVRGWIYYFCKIQTHQTDDLWYWLNVKIMRWAMHKRKFGKKRAIKWMRNIYQRQPDLFLHWKLVKP